MTSALTLGSCFTLLYRQKIRIAASFAVSMWRSLGYENERLLSFASWAEYFSSERSVVRLMSSTKKVLLLIVVMID